MGGFEAVVFKKDKQEEKSLKFWNSEVENSVNK